MFNVGEYIIYGSVGVCRIDRIGPISIDRNKSDRQYYTLTPVYENGSKVFTPVDNDKVIMRPVLTRDEAWKLMNEIDELETLPIPFEKTREEVYKEAVRKCDCREWIKIIKTLNCRKKERNAEGKKTVNTDEKYLHMAKTALCSELAIALNMKQGEVESIIETRVQV